MLTAAYVKKFQNVCREGCLKEVFSAMNVRCGEYRSPVNAEGSHKKGEPWDTTALMIAVTYGRYDVMLSLLSLGSGSADINAINKNGQTALMIASAVGYVPTASLGKGHRTFVKIGESPFVELATSVSLLRYLISMGADISAVDKSGCSALYYARDQPDIVEYLIYAGADVRAAEKKILSETKPCPELISDASKNPLVAQAKLTAKFDALFFGLKMKDAENAVATTIPAIYIGRNTSTTATATKNTSTTPATISDLLAMYPTDPCLPRECENTKQIADKNTSEWCMVNDDDGGG